MTVHHCPVVSTPRGGQIRPPKGATQSLYPENPTPEEPLSGVSTPQTDPLRSVCVRACALRTIVGSEGWTVWTGDFTVRKQTPQSLYPENRCPPRGVDTNGHGWTSGGDRAW